MMKVRDLKNFALTLPLFVLTGCDSIPDPTKYDINRMLAALRSNLPAVQHMIVGMSYLIGVALMTNAVIKLKQYGEARAMMASHAAFFPQMVKFLIGILLMMLPSTLDISIKSLWGTDSTLRYDYAGIFPVGFKETEEAVLDIIKIMGYIALVRGFLLLKNASVQGAPQGTFGKGVTHVIGGLLSINIVGTIDIIRNTFNL